MGDITFREIKLEGGWLMVRPERQDLGKAMALVRKHKNRLYDLDVKEHREKRSLDANAYAWVLIHKLAAAMGIPPVEVYRNAVRGVGDNYTPMCVREQDVERFTRNWQKKRPWMAGGQPGRVSDTWVPEPGGIPRLQHLRHQTNGAADRQSDTGLQGAGH